MVDAMHFVEEWPPMTMASLSFLYVFFPLAVLVFLISPDRRRPATLMGISVAYYALAGGGWLLPLLLSLGLDWGAVVLMQRWENRPGLRRCCAYASMIKNFLLVFGGAILLQINGEPLRLPLGVFVYGLSAVGAVYAIYKEEGTASFVRLGLYLLFFPRLYAGPLLSYREFEGQLERLRPTARGMLRGGGEFLRGVFRYAILGRPIYRLYAEMKGYTAAESTLLSTWMMVLCLALALYYILSGYGEMARGLGRIFGLHLPQNFYYPYQSRSVTDFFQRFNITWHSLLWKRVYGVLRDEEHSAAADILNLAVVGMLAGIWFGLRVNYMLWGAYLVLFLSMEKYVYPRLLKRIPVILCRIYTLCVVLAGFTILAGDSPVQSGGYLLRMFRFAPPATGWYNSQILYLLASNWLLLALACLLAANGLSMGRQLLRREAPKVSQTVETVLDLGLLVLYTALAL